MNEDEIKELCALADKRAAVRDEETRPSDGSWESYIKVCAKGRKKLMENYGRSSSAFAQCGQ